MQNNQKVLLLGGGTSSSMLLSLLFEQGGGGGSSTTFTTVNYNEGLTSTVYTANTGAGTVAMESTLDAAFFSFNTSSGELNFLSAPDFENPFGASNVYVVDIVTTDGNGDQSTVRVTVRVQAVSDNAPTFSGPPPTPTTVTVAEDVSDQDFFTPTVSDADLPPETLTYSIVGGADAGEFTINTTTGAIRFTSPADADAAQTVFNVSLGVTDGAFSDTHALQVTVTDVADEVPVFTSGLTVSTPENNSAVFYTAQATADLSGSAITYTTSASGVTLDATSGELNFTAPGADFETATSHVIPITATDAQGLSAAINLTVTVTDVVEAQPSITLMQIAGYESNGLTAKSTTLDSDDRIVVALVTDEAITVTGTPEYTIDVGSVSRVAGYVSGDGQFSSPMRFEYVVQSGDIDTSGGITSGAAALSLAGGTMKNASGVNLDLTTLTQAPGANPVTVDATTTVAGILLRDGSTLLDRSGTTIQLRG